MKAKIEIIRDDKGHELYGGRPIHESNNMPEKTYVVKGHKWQQTYVQTACKFCGCKMSKPTTDA